MKRYKLPDALGGGEIEATEFWGGCAGGRPEYYIGRISVIMPEGMPLTELPPPTPPEPEPGAYLIGGEFIAVRFAVDESWVIARDNDIEWDALCHEIGGPDVTITRLVPALPEVELPWIDRVIGTTQCVDVAAHKIEVFDGGAWLAPDVAEAKAAALLTAARVARSKS